MHLQSLMLLRLTVKEMHLQENTVFDLEVWYLIVSIPDLCNLTYFDVQVRQDVALYPLHHVTYAHVHFEVATSNCLGGDAFTRKYII